MKIKLILFLLLFVSGCTFQVNVLEPQSTGIGSTASPTTPSISTSTPMAPTATSTSTSAPTPSDIPSPVPPITTGPSNASSIVPIVFAPNATSQGINGNIANGSSQSYSLNAFQGQIMSVSILPEKPELQNAFQLEIRGRDGTVLCPTKDNPCSFWRGALPSTQEYLIKVLADNGGAFSMRVAINPPGTVSQLFNYTDPQGRFALTYPDDYAPVYYQGAQVTKAPPDFSLQYIDTQQYLSTNLSEVYFLVDVSKDPQIVSTCTQPLSFDQPETELGDTTINGITFAKSQGGGVGAGNIYEQVYYRAEHNGSCYEITYFVHYGNIGNYTPGAVTEFDRTALYQQLDEILASLILKS
ncbi:MAG: hypothetical protein ACM3PS_13355 [Syntrophothermus sp.]